MKKAGKNNRKFQKKTVANGPWILATDRKYIRKNEQIYQLFVQKDPITVEQIRSSWFSLHNNITRCSFRVYSTWYQCILMHFCTFIKKQILTHNLSDIPHTIPMSSRTKIDPLILGNAFILLFHTYK